MPASQKPTATARQGGGFNQGFGDFSDEHLEQNALSQAVNQQKLAQQGSNSGTTTGNQHQLPGQAKPPSPPREIGSLWDELVKEPAKDIFKGLMSLFDFSQALGIDPPQTKTPQEQANMQAMHKRYQQLDQEQQAFAQKRYQEKLQKEKLEREEKARKDEAKKRQEAQSIAVPSSPKKGPVGPAGSGKKRAVAKLEQDRKTLSGPASAN